MALINYSKTLNFLAQQAITQPLVGNMRLAAAVVWKNEMIVVGENRMKSHPFQAKYGKNSDSIFLHAETDALIRAAKILDREYFAKCTLCICRVKKDSTWGLACPCPGCQRAIQDSGIKNVVFSTGYNHEYAVWDTTKNHQY